MHKTISAAGVLLIAVGTTSVMAADLPSRKSPPVPLAPPIINWTGVYVGGQVGVQWGDTSWNRFNSSNNNLIASEIPYATNGVVGGGHIGYNYQANQFVFGLEGDFEGTNFKGNGVSTANTAANTLQADYEASIRARAGIAWEHLLVYITGGGAYENFHLAAQNPPGVSYATQKFGRIGWTAGGGIEYAFDSHWSVRFEDRFSDYGNNTLNAGAEYTHQHVSDNRVEAGFSYKFDMFAPPTTVITKY